jgi:hypothetical protein
MCYSGRREKMLKLAKAKFSTYYGEIEFQSLLGLESCNKIEAKFENIDHEILKEATGEVVKFLILGTNKKGSLFFPGNKLVDDIWHSLIIETANYREICRRLNNDEILDHTGIHYDDYSKNKTSIEMHEEQFSWLANYVYNFGSISKVSYELLPLVQYLCKSLNLDLDGINKFSEILIKESHPEETFNFNNYLKDEVDKKRKIIDSNSFELFKHLKIILKNSTNDLSNNELELLFYYSPALAFSIWQHCAALEKIKQSQNWITLENSFFKNLHDLKLSVALATTHIAKEFNFIECRKFEDQYILNGTIPWCSGITYFDLVLVALKIEDQIVLALTDFKDTEHEFYDLEIFNGTSSGKLKLKNKVIKKEQLLIFSSELKFSNYKFPELGILKRAIDEMSVESGQKFTNRLNDLINSKEFNPKRSQTILEKDKLIRDAVRYLMLEKGSSCLNQNSLSFQLHKEVAFMDAVFEPFDVKVLKKNLCIV